MSTKPTFRIARFVAAFSRGTASARGGCAALLAGLLLIPCACGVRIKAPSGSSHKELECPKCGTGHKIPRAGGGQAAKESDAPQTLTHRRRGQGWDSFECACGRAHQISPAMKTGRLSCPRCKRKIEITA